MLIYYYYSYMATVQNRILYDKHKKSQNLHKHLTRSHQNTDEGKQKRERENDTVGVAERLMLPP